MRRRRCDSTHKQIADVLRLLGLPFLDTSGAGGGLADFVVAMPPKCGRSECHAHGPWYLELEAKTIERESTGYIRYTEKQKEWRSRTPNHPRITCTSGQDAEKQLRALMGI